MRRPWALPLVPLYAVGLALKKRLARPRPRRPPTRLPRHQRRLPLCRRRGQNSRRPHARRTPHPATASPSTSFPRGYGRGSGAIEAVDPTGSARRFGDEPLLMTQTGLPSLRRRRTLRRRTARRKHPRPRHATSHPPPRRRLPASPSRAHPQCRFNDIS